MKIRCILGVCGVAALFMASGCASMRGAEGLGFPTGRRGDALPTIRLVPVDPPRGEATYPKGTKIDKHAGVIYFPPGGGASTIWLGLEISGWGKEGLTGYDAYIANDPYCPIAPCPCKPESFSPPCQSSEDCVKGSNCEAGACETAFILAEHKDYVFEEMAHERTADETPNGYHFRARLDPMERPLRDRGRRKSAGTLVRYTPDWCPGPSQWRIDVTPQTRMILGNGHEVKPPLLGHVTIVQQQAP